MKPLKVFSFQLLAFVMLPRGVGIIPFAGRKPPPTTDGWSAAARVSMGVASNRRTGEGARASPSALTRLGSRISDGRARELKMEYN